MVFEFSSFLVPSGNFVGKLNRSLRSWEPQGMPHNSRALLKPAPREITRQAGAEPQGMPHDPARTPHQSRRKRCFLKRPEQKSDEKNGSPTKSSGRRPAKGSSRTPLQPGLEPGDVSLNGPSRSPTKRTAVQRKERRPNSLAKVSPNEKEGHSERSEQPR